LSITAQILLVNYIPASDDSNCTMLNYLLLTDSFGPGMDAKYP